MGHSLRILLVLENPAAGSGRHVVDLASGLVARGDTVHLVYSPLRLQPWFEESVYAIHGLATHRVPMARNPGPRDIQSLRLLRRYLREHGPFDIIHGHSSKGGALARLAALGSGGAAVYTPHAFVTLDPTLPMLRRFAYSCIERALGSICKAIICVSREERQHARSLGLPAAKLFVVNNGLGPLAPANRSLARREIGADEDTLCIGFVGRLDPQKCTTRLVDAFAQIRPRFAKLRLVFVGSGSESQALQGRAERLGVSDDVIFMGEADGPALMSGFDVFALPSRYEGFPYVLLEAVYRQLPIVTMDVGGASALVHDGRNGIVIPQNDVSRFSDALSTLCESEELRARMADYARDLIEDFTLEKMVDRTRQIYTQAITARDGPAPGEHE